MLYEFHLRLKNVEIKGGVTGQKRVVEKGSEVRVDARPGSQQSSEVVEWAVE